MSQPISQRIQDVQAPMIPVVGEMIAAHPGTISLGQGIVHYGPPAEVAKAVADAADATRSHRYGLVRGIDPLLEVIATKLADDNNVTVTDRQRVVVTAGSNMGFQNAVLAIADPGDEIVIQSPYYFNHEMAIAIAGCKAVVVPTDASYQPDLPAIEAAITDRTRAIVTISPNNPTGAVYSRQALGAINDLCKSRGIYHISDEAYEYFVHGEAGHFSPASIEGSGEHTISLFSLSKAYGMAGWRVGYMLIPDHLEEPIKKIQDTNLICPPIISQVAAEAALQVGGDWVREQAKPFAGVRDMVLDELAKLGDRITVPQPDGAFYVMMRVNSERKDMQLVEKLIAEHGVAVMPGNTFGVEGCSLRIAYGALARETVAQGMGRLVQGLEALL